MPVNDSLAFTLFVAVFCGGLAAVTIGIFWIAVALLRRNRAERPFRPPFSLTDHATLEAPGPNSIHLRG